MVAFKTVCLARLGVDRAGQVGAGEFLGNEKVTADKIIQSWPEHTGPACAGRHVLAIQDTSDIVFPTRAQRRRGLGPVQKGHSYGLSVHAMIAVDAQNGACLGLVGGAVWSRDGVATTDHHDRPLSERESMRWLTTAQQAKKVLHEARMVTVLADRESDFYANWASIPEPGVHLLTRAMKDKRLAPDGAKQDASGRDGLLFAAMDRFAVAGRRTMDLPGRALGEAARTAKLAIRFGRVEIARPRDTWSRGLPPKVALHAVDVREIDAPEGAEPLHWRLLTTHAITTASEAWEMVDLYRLRWCIEQLFRLMKSQGLQLEDSQVTCAERLVKLAAIATKAACIDLQLTQERDGRAGLPASTLFDPAQIETIEALCPTLEGNTERQRNPHTPRSLARASWVIARLGGWNCYYKPAGPIRMRRGYDRFAAIHQGRLLSLAAQRLHP